MTIVQEIKGDLLDESLNFDYIIHQCNCLTTSGAGLASAVSNKYPWADPYVHRLKVNHTPDLAGMIKVFKDPKDKVKTKVVSFFSQYYPSTAGKENDSKQLREDWFYICLIQLGRLMKTKNIKVAFPKYIGCDLAGGDWVHYNKMINNFAKENPKVSVYIVSLK